MLSDKASVSRLRRDRRENLPAKDTQREGLGRLYTNRKLVGRIYYYY
jgi:hypothetical protein